MKFINGLKDIFKSKLFTTIFITFIVSMLLFITCYTIIDITLFSAIVIVFMIIFAIFTFILLIFSFFLPVDKLSIIHIISALVLSVPLTILFIFLRIMILMSTFFIYTNQILTAFFAFKLCIDYSLKTDDFLYKKKGSNITRALTFIIFFTLAFLLSIIALRYFRGFPNRRLKNSSNIFVILFWVNLFLIIMVLLRLIFIKRFASYISMFYLLTFFYVLYVILDLWFGWKFMDNAAYDILSFIIDLFLFLYIMGSIFEKVDYIQEKLKIIRAGTIALFVIVMKLVVQINKILQEINYGLTIAELGRQLWIQTVILIIFFVIITLLFGAYYIFTHEPNKKDS